PPASASTLSPSPAAATSLTVDWTAEDLTGIDEVESIIGRAKAGDTYVLLASLQYVDEGSPNSSVSWSDDGTDWTLGMTFPVANRMLALTAGRPGVVASGLSDERPHAGRTGVRGVVLERRRLPGVAVREWTQLGGG